LHPDVHAGYHRDAIHTIPVAKMPEPATLLLIRPRPASERLLRVVETAMAAPVAAVVAPIMEIRPLEYDRTMPEGMAVIVTSANAARFGPDLTGRRVYVVGARTATAVEQAGGKVAFVGADAADLLRYLETYKPGVPLLWLRGRHVVSDLPARLGAQDIQVTQAVVYDQVARPPDPALVRLAQGEARAILPLYSPRSAALVGAAIERVGPGLHVISISPAVAAAWQRETGRASEVCQSPEGAEMERRIIAALRQGSA